MHNNQKQKLVLPKEEQKKSRKAKRLSTASATRKVIVEFSEALLKETEEAASQLSTDRSKLIRSAVESYLARLKKEELEEALAEGYRTHAELDRQIAEEFAHSDNENL
jgi:metal-responsive CopG/Arc/MetJ family transcriptional regulator